MPAVRDCQSQSDDSQCLSLAFIYYFADKPSQRICPDSASTTRTNPASLPNRKSVRSVRKKARAPRVKNKIPRPKNAFIHYRSWLAKHFKKQSSSSSGLQQTEISKLAGRLWREMSPSKRKQYLEEATKEKKLHKEMHPGYVYRSPSAGRQKKKAVNPSKNHRQSDETKEAAPSSVPHTSGKQNPSELCYESSPYVPPNIDVQVVGAGRQWRGEDTTQHQYQVPVLAEFMPSIGLCFSSPSEQKYQTEEDLELKVCRASVSQSLCLKSLFIRQAAARAFL